MELGKPAFVPLGHEEFVDKSPGGEFASEKSIQDLLKAMDAKSLVDVPNAVYRNVTAVKRGSQHCVVFVDVSLADQYGKHSQTSRNASVTFAAPVADSEKLKTDLLAHINSLKDFIQNERVAQR